MASTQIYFDNESDLNVAVGLLYTAGGGFLVSTNTANENQRVPLPCEWVWYDVHARAIGSDKDIAIKGGVYANSTVTLKGANGSYYLQ
ncbi:MAG: hypothetical protein KME17_14055 [Cyanosarcina radialis HA8281-LM2]|jgi:hypothetical protein|nr:hypothetical protein [Cyanosarcina radialis HA8281-LM2]